MKIIEICLEMNLPCRKVSECESASMASVSYDFANKFSYSMLIGTYFILIRDEYNNSYLRIHIT